MPVHLRLRAADGVCQARLAATDRLLAEANLDALPAIERLRERPYEAGFALYQALGGRELDALLEADGRGVLLLECDERSAAVAWEYATTGEGRLLACEYGMLRLVPRAPLPFDTARPPRLLVLCADPLVYPGGAPPSYRLDFDHELAELRGALQNSDRSLVVQRLPPTAERLVDALADGPALIHLSCHGALLAGEQSAGQDADVALALEDAIGQCRPLTGRDLRRDAPRGSIRLVLLSACRTAPLAQALAREGIPVALGMQHSFPDPQSAALAATFYRRLCADRDVAEAARQARRAIAAEDSGAAGMLVAYTCEDAWGPLALPPGQPDIRLDPPGDFLLPRAMLVPGTAMLGRDEALAGLARAYDGDAPAVTVAGTGGIGKTTLAAAFLRRFGWRFRRVLGVTFAGTTVDRGRVCRELLEQLRLGQAAQAAQDEVEQARAAQVRALRARLHELELQQAKLGLHAPPHIATEIAEIAGQLAALDAQDLTRETADRLQERLLAAVEPGDLLLFDNYESVLHPQEAEREQAAAIERLLPMLIAQRARLLLTSRTRPAGLRGEVLFPSREGLAGLELEPAAALFLEHATRDQDGGAQHRRVADEVARLTGGHPLAVVLLARAYDAGDADAGRFLADWPAMLARARHAGLAAHHLTFATAVEYSLRALDERQRARLIELARYDVPFYAEGAALLWSLPAEGGDPTEAALDEARRDLALYVRRSLLEVEGRYTGTDTPATYRFQPALRQELRRRAGDDAATSAGYAAYGAWLARRAYGKIGSDIGLAKLVRQCFDLLDAATEALAGEEQLWHIRRVAWLRQQYGELAQARAQLGDALAVAAEQTAVRSALQHELAYIYWVQGDLTEAMRLYRDSLAIKEQLGDLQGKGATLHQMAYIYRAQGELDEAMRLYQDSLAITEQLGDLQGKAATLNQMAYIYRVQDKLDEAMRLYQDSLAIKEQWGDLQGKGITLHEMAFIYIVRGDLTEALRLYSENLAIKEQLGDLQGRTTTLHQIASIFILQQQWETAEQTLQSALQIARQLGNPSAIAFCIVKLGKVSEALGDRETALARYREGLATFERLGMPRESQQVRDWIAEIETQDRPSASLDAKIAAWSASTEDDATRAEELVRLLNACADATIQALRAGDTEAAEHLAQALIPLRLALREWPAAANLPPFNVFLGCLQALLRGDAAGLARLRAGLDAGLAGALAQVEREIAGDEAA